jgi:hypothetical protein
MRRLRGESSKQSVVRSWLRSGRDRLRFRPPRDRVHPSRHANSRRQPDKRAAGPYPPRQERDREQRISDRAKVRPPLTTAGTLTRTVPPGASAVASFSFGCWIITPSSREATENLGPSGPRLRAAPRQEWFHCPGWGRIRSSGRTGAAASPEEDAANGYACDSRQLRSAADDTLPFTSRPSRLRSASGIRRGPGSRPCGLG